MRALGACGGSSILPTETKKAIMDYVTTFLALFFTDAFYTYYLRAVNNNEVFKSSCWAVAVYLMAGVAIINYTSNHWMLIPACAGAFCGTWVGMKIRRR
jgi:uncharacterized membrane protein YfcA